MIYIQVLYSGLSKNLTDVGTAYFDVFGGLKFKIMRLNLKHKKKKN